jgi:aryl-alcohol dehydrogenase-like predicted oxidoreductase
MNQTIRIGDLTVNRIGFGAMRLCGPGVWGLPAEPASAIALLRVVVERGVTLIDTSNAYGPDVNEEQIAEALAPYPAGLLIATKGGLLRPAPGRWVPDGRPDELKKACEGSLRRLRLETIDLYQLHSPDPKVPFEESVGALRDLRDAGKIRHVGLSNVDVDELARAREIVPIVSVQNHYNLGARGDDDVVDACERAGIAFLPYFPIAAGELARAAGALEEIASAHNATTAQIALAWLLARSPQIAPIPGTSSRAHLEENIGALAIELADDEYEALAA